MNSKLHLLTQYTMDQVNVYSPSQMELMRKHRQEGCEVGGGVVEYQGSRHSASWSRKKEFKRKQHLKTKGSGFPTYNKYSNDKKTLPFYKVKRDFKSPMTKKGTWERKITTKQCYIMFLEQCLWVVIAYKQ